MDTSLSRLRIFSAACALFGAMYGAFDLDPAPGMALLLLYGPVIGVTVWLAKDGKRRRVVGAHDAGLFFYLTWPLTITWYALRTRGRSGWSLAAELYALALAGQLGIILGRTLRFLLSNNP
jgi:hypothetical protein